jgi:hypothetical protein
MALVNNGLDTYRLDDDEYWEVNKKFETKLRN